jgi:hypothetical protein
VSERGGRITHERLLFLGVTGPLLLAVLSLFDVSLNNNSGYSVRAVAGCVYAGRMQGHQRNHDEQGQASNDAIYLRCFISN